MGSVLFRVDGSSKIGWGHLMRCVALAEEFRKKGVDTVFVLRHCDAKVLRFLKELGLSHKKISSREGFSEDVFLISKIASKYHARVVFLDVSHPRTLVHIKDFARHLRELKALGYYVVLIDGGLSRDCLSRKEPLAVDVVVIPYFGADKKKYRWAFGTKALLGPDYFIFRKEFTQPVTRKGRIRKNAENILLTIGGSDPQGLTPRAIELLMRINRSALSVNVVEGKGFSGATKRKIKRLGEKWHAGRFMVTNGSGRISDMMKVSDMAIMGDGLTQYEAALLGLPYVTVSVRDFKRPHRLISRIEELLKSAGLRKKLSEERRRHLDGKGVKRVIAEIPKELLR